MTEEQYPDPFGDAAGLTTQSLFRNAVAVVAVTRVCLQARARAHQRRTIRDERERRALEAQERTERDAVRARWEPAADRQWLRSADLPEVAEAWSAAVHYADPASDLYERSAEVAVENCEERLRELHPYAMRHYDRLRADGLSRIDAIGQAAALFLNHPNARPHGGQARPAIAVGGLGHTWVAEVHGPSGEEFELHKQTARGSRIVEGMQTRATAEGRPLLDPDEQRTALEAATSLPPDLIGKVVQAAASPRPARRPWENESPFPIEEVVALAARRPEALAGPAPRPNAGHRPGRVSGA